MTKNFSKNFSLKLALNNIKNNRKFYLPYFLASVGIIAMFYIIVFLASSPEISAMSMSLSTIMVFGTVIMGIFSFIFLFYTNSFLMKRRKKEIGIYNILGMEKKHIGKILTIENFMVSAVSLISGILCGILFSKLIHLMLAWAFGGETPFGMHVSAEAVRFTVIPFTILFILTMISNLMSIHLAKPIELLYGGNVGEKEPKTKWILAVIGAVCLGVGYFIAITTESPLTAIVMFFVAVVLVIIGTYCLFTAGSVVILKALKKNKKFYYKPENFTAVSGMIYRMKQNAVGLANICILSTMVLVMVSGTVSLYAGMQDILDTRFAGDAGYTFGCEEEQVDREKVMNVIKETADREGLKLTGLKDYRYLAFMTTAEENEYTIELESSGVAENGNLFSVITAEEYEKLTGEKVSLQKDQILAYSRGSKLSDEFTLGESKFRVKERVDSFVVTEDLEAYMVDVHYIVVADDDVLMNLYGQQKVSFGGNASYIKYQFAADFKGTDEQKIDCTYKIFDNLGSADLGGYEYLFVESRQEVAKMYKELVGGFLFLGIFLGIVFTFAAALIIYYKQISEGYYDKAKFEIMQKVGMSKAEVKKTIRRQVLMVFFIPLIMAGIHVLAAFKMIARLLLVFSMNNVPLFAVCTVVTFLVFALIYALVYVVTAREYYKIVG